MASKVAVVWDLFLHISVLLLFTHYSQGHAGNYRNIFISHIDIDALSQSSCILVAHVVAAFHTIAYHLCL